MLLEYDVWQQHVTIIKCRREKITDDTQRTKV